MNTPAPGATATTTPVPSTSPTPGTATITLGGGCFWCLEAVYEQVVGVLAVESGYCNGHVLNPSYEQVCSGRSGHVEVVQVTFDPARLSLRDVLAVFFAIHDPTTLNRQGNDAGPQYRSGIYWHDASQLADIQAVMAELASALAAAGAPPPVTEVLPRENYSTAEAYHQHYFARNPHQGYCAWVVGPKVEKFQQRFAHLVRAQG